MTKKILDIKTYIVANRSNYILAGESLKKEIVQELSNNNEVVLNFEGYDEVGVTRFLNTAVGELYKTYDSKKLNKSLSVRNISHNSLRDLKDVIEIAKKRFEK